MYLKLNQAGFLSNQVHLIHEFSHNPNKLQFDKKTIIEYSVITTLKKYDSCTLSFTLSAGERSGCLL